MKAVSHRTSAAAARAMAGDGAAVLDEYVGDCDDNASVGMTSTISSKSSQYGGDSNSNSNSNSGNTNANAEGKVGGGGRFDSGGSNRTDKTVSMVDAEFSPLSVRPSASAAVAAATTHGGLRMELGLGPSRGGREGGGGDADASRRNLRGRSMHGVSSPSATGARTDADANANANANAEAGSGNGTGMLPRRRSSGGGGTSLVPRSLAGGGGSGNDLAALSPYSYTYAPSSEYPDPRRGLYDDDNWDDGPAGTEDDLTFGARAAASYDASPVRGRASRLPVAPGSTPSADDVAVALVGGGADASAGEGAAGLLREFLGSASNSSNFSFTQNDCAGGKNAESPAAWEFSLQQQQQQHKNMCGPSRPLRSAMKKSISGSAISHGDSPLAVVAGEDEPMAPPGSWMHHHHHPPAVTAVAAASTLVEGVGRDEGLSDGYVGGVGVEPKQVVPTVGFYMIPLDGGENEDAGDISEVGGGAGIDDADRPKEDSHPSDEQLLPKEEEAATPAPSPAAADDASTTKGQDGEGDLAVEKKIQKRRQPGLIARITGAGARCDDNDDEYDDDADDNIGGNNDTDADAADTDAAADAATGNDEKEKRSAVGALSAFEALSRSGMNVLAGLSMGTAVVAERTLLSGKGGMSVEGRSRDAAASTSSSRAGSAAHLQAGNAAIFSITEEFFHSCVVSPEVRRVVQLCFSAMCVVFVETVLPSSKSGGGGGINIGGGGKGGGGEPFRYTRMPSIPAGAARMLWKELIGSDVAPTEVDFMGADGNVRYDFEDVTFDRMGQIRRDPSLGEHEVTTFFDEIKIGATSGLWSAGRRSDDDDDDDDGKSGKGRRRRKDRDGRGSNGDRAGSRGQSRSRSQNRDRSRSQSRRQSRDRSRELASQRGRRSSRNNAASKEVVKKRSSSRDAHSKGRSRSRERAEQIMRDMEAAKEREVKAAAAASVGGDNGGILSPLFRFGFGAPRIAKPDDVPNTVGDTLHASPRGGLDGRSETGSECSHALKGEESTDTTFYKAQGGISKKPTNQDPFFRFIRDSLVGVNVLEVAGKMDGDSDLSGSDSDDEDLSANGEEGGDEMRRDKGRSLGSRVPNSVRSITSFDSEGSDQIKGGSSDRERSKEEIDYSGWEEKERRRRRRRLRRTQYLQIQRDMQHQYGVFLSALPMDEGGFGINRRDEGVEIIEDEENGSLAVLEREHDTMKRWNGYMADACWKKRYRRRFEEGMAFDRFPQKDDVLVGVPANGQGVETAVAEGDVKEKGDGNGNGNGNGNGDSDDRGLGGSDAKGEGEGKSKVDGEYAECHVISYTSGTKQIELPNEPWLYEDTKEYPLDDAIRYSLRMLPTHLMRSGRVRETATLLTDHNFFLGRVRYMGAEKASLVHRQDLTELEKRVSFAKEGYVDVGGDGNKLDAPETMALVLRSMVKVLTKKYAKLVENGEKNNAGSGKNKRETSDDAEAGSNATPTSISRPAPFHQRCMRTSRKTYKAKGEKIKGETGRALHGIAWQLGRMGLSDDSVAVYSKALKYKKATLGRRHPSVAGTLHNMGNLYLDRAEYGDALACYKNAMDIERKVLGSVHKNVARTLNSMGMIYGMTGDYDRAVEAYTEALAIAVDLDGENDLGVAETLNSLGIVQGIRNNYHEAAHCYSQALRIKMAALGEDHEEVADTLFSLGIIQNKIGDYEGAVDSYQRALKVRKASLGDDHEEVARILHCLGIVLNDIDEVDGSIRCYEESLRIRLLRLGDEHEDVARTLNNLGLVYFKSGDYDRAMECFKGTLRVSKQKLGSKHEKIADTLNSMGQVYQKKGKLDSAMECFTESLDIRKVKLGNDHLDVAEVLHNMGDVHYMLGEVDRAMEDYSEAFRIRFFKLGTDHADVAATRNNMGVVHLKKNQNKQAMECFKEAFRVRSLILGPDHEKVGDTLHNMGLVHKNLKQHDEAVHRYEQALRVRKLKLGDNSIKVADTLYNMAIVCANQGRYSVALNRYKEALRTYRETGLQDNHPSILNTLQWIKWAQKQLDAKKVIRIFSLSMNMRHSVQPEQLLTLDISMVSKCKVKKLLVHDVIFSN